MDTPLEESTFMVPLGVSAHRRAARRCQPITNSQQAKQIYLQTLAVAAVEFYLQCMGVEITPTDESQRLVQQIFMNVADIELPGFGRLECCAVGPGETTVMIPLEARTDRVGYVVVQVEPSLKQAVILGYVPQLSGETLALNALRSLDELMRHLQATIQTAPRVNLSQWLHQQFEAGWQAIADLLPDASPALAYRTATRSQPETIRRAKIINLNVQLVEQGVVLLVAITPEANQTVSVSVQVHPLSGTPYLPPDLTISLRSDTEELQQVRSRSHDNYMQLPRFRGTVAEQFQLQLRLGDTTVIERFTI